MNDLNWKPLFRTPTSSLSKILRSRAFLHSRERSTFVVTSSYELRALADQVETLNQETPPLAAVADRVAAAVRFLRDRASRLDDEQASTSDGSVRAEHPDGRTLSASVEAHERLLVASLHYLVTPDDLVPDFRPGGYIDDVYLLAWVFGVASNELKPYLTSDLGDETSAAVEPTA